ANIRLLLDAIDSNHGEEYAAALASRIPADDRPDATLYAAVKSFWYETDIDALEPLSARIKKESARVTVESVEVVTPEPSNKPQLTDLAKQVKAEIDDNPGLGGKEIAAKLGHNDGGASVRRAINRQLKGMGYYNNNGYHPPAV
ncbi:MAG: hypothetical protein AAFX76_07510, partial [Planctomycetota bacterium]